MPRGAKKSKTKTVSCACTCRIPSNSKQSLSLKQYGYSTQLGKRARQKTLREAVAGLDRERVLWNLRRAYNFNKGPNPEAATKLEEDIEYVERDGKRTPRKR